MSTAYNKKENEKERSCWIITVWYLHWTDTTQTDPPPPSTKRRDVRVNDQRQSPDCDGGVEEVRLKPCIPLQGRSRALGTLRGV
ncbi:unnamed protein product [Larinioides sclopetarius]|uniref:Uncharacterized protein n=1 Tax=Larinioides sclopetarius TaxID=280406 RepID=A0AAV2AVU4_9ARAC